MNGGKLYSEASWQPPSGVRALYTLRRAGSFGRGEAQQRQELARLADLPREPAWLAQVHGIDVVDLDAPLSAAEPQGDAAITTRPGVVCAVLTADCLPVLLAAADGSAVGAAHAGWRGLVAGVIEATVRRLRERCGEVPLQAWLGPAIGAAHFEVGGEVRDAFLAHDEAASEAFLANDRGRWQCDLYRLARQRLTALGIADVAGGEHCTFAEAPRFFSHRRDVGSGRSASTGRMATLIWRTA